MKSKVAVAGIVATIVLIGAGIWAFNAQKAAAPEPATETNTTSTQPSGTEAVNDTPAADEQTNTVTITYTDNGFDKTSYTIQKGETVKVVNNSSAKMEFASADHPTHQENSELNLEDLAPGESTTFAPTKVGTWGVHDHEMANHTATLIVTE